ncbi:MAG: TonB-dependent receptor [Opitutaceae bacterium]|nr:TonB-dependent receptor [Opitutaceae bacterium]
MKIYRLRAIPTCLALILVPFSHAQLTTAPSETGIVEGRVSNADTGEYLELVRLTVAGTELETFSDTSGRYRLTNVPAGAAQIKAFRTGLAEQTVSVRVAPGQPVVQDFGLAAPRRRAPGDETIKLDQFVVASSKEMDNAALAINTQRFAANQLNVIAADEFGGAAESKVGEVLKSLPGISMTLGGGGEPYQVSLDGVPAENVPVTVGGFDLASSGAGTGRATGLHQTAINTISRIEVSHTPTPESSGSALAGSVNLVPLNAFDRAKPHFSVSVLVSMRDEARSLDRTPGPLQRPTHKIRPGFEFTGIVPVNKRFGFTVSASASTLYRVQDMSQSTWRGAGAVTNGNTLPDTTPDRPYLSDYAMRDGGAMVTAASFGTTLDVQLGTNDQVSLGLQWAFSDFALTQRVMNFFVNRVAPGDFTPTSTRGFRGAGEVRINNTVNGLGGNLVMPTLAYRHNGPIWQWEAGAGHSKSRRWRKDATKGNFFNSVARRQNVTVSFDDIFYLRPNQITVTDGTTGAAVDPYRLDNYVLTTASTNAFETVDLHRTAYANLRRSFFGRVPLTLKGGLDVRQQVRDNRTTNPTLTLVGPDRLPNSADDYARQVIDADYSTKTAPFGFPAIEWTSNFRLWDIYETNPGYFTENAATSYTQQVAQSRHAEEIISAAYLRADTKLLRGRLKLVGGVRAEQTNVEMQGRLVDPTRNFQRDSSGRVIPGPTGTPRLITTDPLETVRLTNVDRGLRAEKEYLRWFPSINASYNVTDNLVGRAGYYWSVGRPDFNQYGGSVNLPNTENPPGPNNQISINNAGIKAWSAQTVKVALEYYFEPVGLISVSAFQRDFKNMFGQTVVTATPEFLGLYGLNPEIYGDYDVSTQYNLPGTVRATGVSVNYKQALTFLPDWGRGVRVFANGSAQRVTGDISGSFNGYMPRGANWGVSLSRPKYSLRVNWNYTGKRRLGPVAAGRGIEPGTYNWAAKRLVVDVNAEYIFWRRTSVFAALNNILNEPVDNKIHGPSTPDYARFRQRQNYGALWTFGVKSVF